MSRRPAILGGKPVFRHPLYITKPALPELDDILPKFRSIFSTGILSNNGQFVREFERLACQLLEVRNCVAMCNGTLTLLLALKAFNIRGKVIVPSFTFCATVHAVKWAGLEPVFADIDPHTFDITPQTIEKAISDDVSAVMPVHVFGMPCDVDGILKTANLHGLRVLFDSAQATGSSYYDKPLGSFGDAESFSAHATKIVPAGEGGFVTTNDDEIAEYLRSMRGFGVSGDVDCTAVGINAKMSEMAAALAIEGLKSLDSSIAHRRRLTDLYQSNLSKIPGVTFQRETDQGMSNHQNFAILIDPKYFGISRDGLADALKAENVFARKYFYPPIHSTSAYAGESSALQADLPVTRRVSESVLCLPLYSEMPEADVDKVCDAIHDIHAYACAMKYRLAVAEPASPWRDMSMALPGIRDTSSFETEESA